MTGFMKIDAKGEGEISIETRLEHVNMLDKAHILHSVFTGLHVDTSDTNEVAMMTALAMAVGHAANKTQIDLGMLEAMMKTETDEEQEV